MEQSPLLRKTHTLHISNNTSVSNLPLWIFSLSPKNTSFKWFYFWSGHWLCVSQRNLALQWWLSHLKWVYPWRLQIHWKSTQFWCGGGLAVFYWDTFSLAELQVPDSLSFECLAARCLTPELPVNYLFIDHPGLIQTFYQIFQISSQPCAPLFTSWWYLVILISMWLPPGARWLLTTSTSWIVSHSLSMYKGVAWPHPLSCHHWWCLSYQHPCSWARHLCQSWGPCSF